MGQTTEKLPQASLKPGQTPGHTTASDTLVLAFRKVIQHTALHKARTQNMSSY